MTLVLDDLALSASRCSRLKPSTQWITKNDGNIKICWIWRYGGDFWVVTPCSLIKVHWCFGGTYDLLHAMKTYEGVEVQLHLSWPRHSMEVSGQLHTLSSLPPKETLPGTHWIGPRAGLDAVEKKRILHCRESIPGPPACSPPLYRLSYPDSTGFWCRVCVCVCVCVCVQLIKTRE
jgi:hypothetical protein